MDRYPKDTIVSIDDFRASNWKQIITSTDKFGYYYISGNFFKAAKDAISDNNYPLGKLYYLIADACSMMLKPDSINEPFDPLMSFEGGRSALPEDFNDSDIVLFALISKEIDHPLLKARLSDLVWLLTKPRNYEHAIIAINSYIKIPLEKGKWIYGGRECWHRMLNLVKLLGRGARDKEKEIEKEIIERINANPEGDKHFIYQLTETAFKFGLGQDHCSAIADMLFSFAQESFNDEDYWRCREYFSASSKWYKSSNNDEKAYKAIIKTAESYVKEAEKRSLSPKGSHVLAVGLLEDAIQTYRSVPKSERKKNLIDEKIKEIYLKLSESGNYALGEFTTITTEPVDISDMVNQVIQKVKGKKLIDAVTIFANLSNGFDKNKLLEQAKDIIDQFPLQRLLSRAAFSADGRVIAKHKGLDFQDRESEEYNSFLLAKMTEHFRMSLDLIVKGAIIPAWQVLTREHRITEYDFIDIARRSPIVPRGRERLFGKALFLGYDGDFTGALHYLVPQVENLVRIHLKLAKAKTTTLNSEGIETENALGTLLELPEASKVFGEDLLLELKALFCDPMGPNLRNELAHGLLGEAMCESVYSVYAWWFCLRIIFNTFWNSLNPEEKKDSSSMSEPDQG